MKAFVSFIQSCSHYFDSWLRADIDIFSVYLIRETFSTARFLKRFNGYYVKYHTAKDLFNFNV